MHKTHNFLLGFSRVLVWFLVFGFAAADGAKSSKDQNEPASDFKWLYDPQVGQLARLQKGRRFFERKQEGSYHFGYDSGPGPLSNWHFREEWRSTSGAVRGRFGFAVSKRFFRVTEYIGDEFGYRAFSKLVPLEEAPATTTTAKTTAPPRARGRNMVLYRDYN